MGSSSTKLLTCFLLTQILSCSGNLYSNYNDKSSKAYIVENAKLKIDQEKFVEALELLYPLWYYDRQNEELAFYYAVAQLGSAGLRILPLITDLAEDLDSKTLLNILGSYFEDADDDSIYGVGEAIRVIEQSADRVVDRSSRMNFLALFANWSKFGTILNRYAYNDDNTVNTEFDACKLTTSASGRTGIPNTSIDDIMISIPRIIELVSVVSGSGDAFDSLLGENFAAFTGVKKTPIPCSANSDNASCLALRSLINLGSADSTTAIGLDTGNYADNVPGGTCDNSVP